MHSLGCRVGVRCCWCGCAAWKIDFYLLFNLSFLVYTDFTWSSIYSFYKYKSQLNNFTKIGVGEPPPPFFLMPSPTLVISWSCKQLLFSDPDSEPRVPFKKYSYISDPYQVSMYWCTSWHFLEKGPQEIIKHRLN